jgi:hypothetical protein
LRPRTAAHSEALRALNLAQGTVKRAQRYVPGFPRYFHHQAIGESGARLISKPGNGRGDRLRNSRMRGIQYPSMRQNRYGIRANTGRQRRDSYATGGRIEE